MKETIDLPIKNKFRLKDLLIGVFFIVISYFSIESLIKLFDGDNFNKTKQLLKNINYVWLVLALIIMLFSTYIRAVKWRMLINTSNKYKPSYKSLFWSLNSFHLANAIIPRSGVGFRAYVLNKSEKIPIDYTLGTLVIERIIDTIIFGACILFSILFNFKEFKFILNKHNLLTDKSIFIFVSVIISIFLISLYFKKKKIEGENIENEKETIFSNMMMGINSYKTLENKKLFLFLTFISWMCFILMTILLLNSFESLSLTINQSLFIFTMGIVGFLIPTPGGIGSYHASVILAFSILGLSSSYGLAFAFLSHAFQYIIGVLLGLIGTIYSFTKKNLNQF